MRNAIVSLAMAFVALFSLVHDANAQVSPSAIFSQLGGTTTIDKGGALHSQTRTIYSMGGGMTSFKGKSITLLAIDPPGVSAGCAGISWHFGGFSFISVDEIRQLVEAVAQASLGVAVDLAMQTLCPQCYAIMSKLREMANQMRNAAADACQIAQRLKSSAMKSDMFSGLASSASCAKQASRTGESDTFLGSMFDTWCNSTSAVNTFLDNRNKDLRNFMSGNPLGTAITPSAEEIAVYGNWTYEGLSALGYPDGVIKDVLLSTMGMTISSPKSQKSCMETLSNMFSDKPYTGDLASTDKDAALTKILDAARAADDANAKKVVESETAGEAAKVSDATVTDPTKAPSDTDKGNNICYAPPLISTLTEFAYHLVCGFKPGADLATFSTKFSMAPERVMQSSFGAMCFKSKDNKPSLREDSDDNPPVYHCIRGTSEKCMKPELKHLKDISPEKNATAYTGVAWMVMDALYRGVIAIKDNVKRENPATEKSALPADTLAIINNAQYPLYRLLNIAAVYPALADDMLQAYGALIATHYVMDTMDKLMTPGGQPQIRLENGTGNMPNMDIMTLRRDIMQQLQSDGGQLRSAVQKRMAEKKALVDIIVQINRTIQAEVVSQGLNNNASLAVSVKKQMEKIPTDSKIKAGGASYSIGGTP